MTHARLHNVLFLIAILAIAAVTAWSIVIREPEPLSPPPQATMPAAKTVDGTGVPEPAAKPEESETRALIDRGILSRQPARYFHKEAP